MEVSAARIFMRNSKKVREGKQNVVRVVSKVVGARQYSKARK